MGWNYTHVSSQRRPSFMQFTSSAKIQNRQFEHAFLEVVVFFLEK
jgi:hypothetical protein